MNITTKSSNELNKRYAIGNAAILLALFVLTFGCWNEYVWYEFMAPLGTLISFVALVVAVFCYVPFKQMLIDKELYLVAIGSAVALVNLFIIHSNKGAFLTAADVLMMLYLWDKIIMSRRTLVITGVYLAFFYFYWTFDVKGYFKGYNTNYGGLVLITGFVYTMVMLTWLRRYFATKNMNRACKWIMVPTVFMFAWGYNIIAWYRARCALIGLVVVLILFFIPRRFFSIKWLYNCFCYIVAVGMIAISGVYILLGRLKDIFTIQIFYKDILSGRDAIWGELWSEYLRHPITGIGSSYTMKLAWMEGMFEVHNGFLDILIVHGAVVFIIAFVLLIKKLLWLRIYVAESETAKIAAVGVFALLVSSYMENFIIVPPFLICFMILPVFARCIQD